MHHMLEEIREQPEVIGKLVEQEQEAAEKLAAEIRRRDIAFVIMAARGTSDHAAIYGKYLLEINNGLPVALADPSVFTLYDAELAMKQAMVIGISQSGKAADVAEYLKRSQKAGALTVAITNESGSPLAKIADHVLLCHAGKEKGVAATKTYTSTLAAFYLASSCLLNDVDRIEALLRCARAMRKALELEEEVAEHSERYRYLQQGSVIARGFNYCTALEIALKLAETSYIGVTGYSAADFLHGPIATVDEDKASILCAPPGKTYSAMIDMAKKLEERKADRIILSTEKEILSLATTPLKLEVEVDEELSPLVYVIPGQLLAYYIAVARGYDPNRPRGLSKVTITR